MGIAEYHDITKNKTRRENSKWAVHEYTVANSGRWVE